MLHAAGGRNRFAQQLFTPLPGRYDLLAEVLSFGQNAGGGAPWSTRSCRRASPGRSTWPPGTAGVAIQLATRPRPGSMARTSTPAMLRQGRRRDWPRRRLANGSQLAAGRAEQLPFPGCQPSTP